MSARSEKDPGIIFRWIIPLRELSPQKNNNNKKTLYVERHGWQRQRRSRGSAASVNNNSNKLVTQTHCRGRHKMCPIHKGQTKQK